MRFFTKYVNLVKYTFSLAMLATALLIFVCVPGLSANSDQTGNNMVSIFVNGTQVGIVKDSSEVNDMVLEARRRLASERDELVLVDCNLVLSGSKDVVGQVNDRDTIVDNIYAVLKENVMKTKQPAYEVKIKDFVLNLGSIDDVIALLNAAKLPYDGEANWEVTIIPDTSRELNVYTTRIVKKSDTEEAADTTEDMSDIFPKGGAILKMQEIYNLAFEPVSKPYEFGVQSIGFDETIEVVKAYVDADKIISLDEAIEAVTKTKEKNRIYEVVSGDTLGAIASKNDMSVDDLLSLNSDSLSGEEAMLRVGDELTIYAPEPELSVVRTERKYFEESFQDEIVYIDNNEWYTNHVEVRQEGIPGYRKVIADLTYRNAELTNTEILYSDVVKKAVAKVVERGTLPPPTYIYPVSGRISSKFGKRTAPTKGASTYHKGLDFAVPTGTAVRASNGGKVIQAGWGRGYGYCVYIQHADGKVTRYGHCSKVLVKAGQSVQQGEKIALSGNTGVSTGPHLHFEILVGGAQVNPLNYLN